MILYMDSSSIVKLYIEEVGARQTHEALARASRAATSILSYAEVRAALASNLRRGNLRRAQLQRIRSDFEVDWPAFVRIPVTLQDVSDAGDLAERHSLSGFDAVHLASVLALRERAPDEVEISTWDRRLADAAMAEGFSLAHEVIS